jgi:hypothetical protein
LQDPPKFTQIGIFGLKIYHLANLLKSGHKAESMENFQLAVASECHPGTEVKMLKIFFKYLSNFRKMSFYFKKLLFCAKIDS